MLDCLLLLLLLVVGSGGGGCVLAALPFQLLPLCRASFFLMHSTDSARCGPMQLGHLTMTWTQAVPHPALQSVTMHWWSAVRFPAAHIAQRGLVEKVHVASIWPHPQHTPHIESGLASSYSSTRKIFRGS